MIKSNKIMSQFLFTGVTLDELLYQIGQLVESKIRHLAPQTEKPKQSDFITRREVCNALKISLPTLHDWTKIGRLKSYKIGNRVLYKESEVLASLQVAQAQKFKRGGYHEA